MNKSRSSADGFLRAIWDAVDGQGDLPCDVAFTGEGALPSAFPVTDLAAGSIAAAALAVAALPRAGGAEPAALAVDRRLASFWFAQSIKPDGWQMPPAWDAVAGDYATADGWIRLHTNAPHHRAAALDVLGMATAGSRPDKARVRDAVSHWQAAALEAAIIARGGCAAAMRDAAAWAEHPHGNSVAAEPLVAWETHDGVSRHGGTFDPDRPLAGIKVLDMTRIVAGPAATRFLAGFGADVLRIDPPGWEEPSLEPEMTLGKRCARLDLRKESDRDRLLALLREADILIHGYRPGALDRLGIGEQRRHTVRPGLIDVSLDAYGWSGPWAGRRGFDSLVQMSTGIADAGMRRFGADKPMPLPVQALDHATGMIMAAAAVSGLARGRADRAGLTARVSLARTAALLSTAGTNGSRPPFREPGPADDQMKSEATAWGPAFRLRPAASIRGTPMIWSRPANRLGSSSPRW